MPDSPLTWLAKMPERLLPIAVERNQPPMPKPTRRTGASLVTIDRPIGDTHSSPMDWITKTMNSVQKGIFRDCGSIMLDSAIIDSRKARPLKMMPRPNLRGIDGLARPSFTQIHATTGARVMIASELTDWNQPTGKIQPPKSRLTMFCARKLNELPACSKNIQNSTL